MSMDPTRAKADALSSDYRQGYVSAVLDQILPEEEVVYFIKGKDIKIVIQNKHLNLQEEEKLRGYLNKTPLFSTINIEYAQDDRTNPSVEHLNIPLKSIPTVSSNELLPNGVIYDSPIADPKWPKFSVGYQRHFSDVYGKNIFKLSFGENLALFRSKAECWTYEVGVQAGLFGVMDMSSNPTRLINSDYFVGFGLSAVYNDKWQNLFQFSHQSSHLGDEFLISKPNYLAKRINLSYEAIKWYTAYKFETFRPYLGLGYLIDRDPSSLKAITCELGLDYISKEKYFWDKTRLVFGVHSHFWQENKFTPTLKVSTGFQLDAPVWKGRNLQFLLNYGRGPSQQGQLYVKRENYISLSIAISS